MAEIPPKFTGTTFDILEPGSVTDPITGIPRAVADSANTVYVRVRNNIGDAATFAAQIFDNAGTAVGPSKILTPEDATNTFYSGCVSVGNGLNAVFTGTPNRKVTVTKNGVTPGNSQSFEAVLGGPGFIGSCSGGSLVGSKGVAATGTSALAKAGNPVPVTLSLQVDAPGGAGDPDADALSRLTTLRFSESSAEECCWLSQPVDACSDRSTPAFWMLRTGDARTWVLILRRGESDVVVYHVTTPAAKAASFPIRMHLAGGDRSWPQAVTVSPAP